MPKLYSLLLIRGIFLSVVLLFVVGTSDIFAQCDPPGQLPTQMCQDAPFTCLLNACYSTQSWPPNGEPPEWCGPNTAVHNPQYFAFIATSTTVQIDIHVNSCVGGGCGLQSAIIDTCIDETPPWEIENVLTCDPGQGVGGTMVLYYDQMVIGNVYWLMIDGCAGQICEYTIEFVEGVQEYDINGELTDAFTNDPEVCQGQDEWTATALPPLDDAHGYLWTGFPWGDGTHTSTFNDMSGPDDPVTIPDDAPPGTYQICVVAFTGCDTTDNPQCFDLTIYAIDDAYSEPDTLCVEDFAGVTWQGIAITGPGVYMKEFNTPEGCPYDSIKEYAAFPEPDDGIIDTVVCEESFTYEGVDYDNAGSYTLQYPDGSIYGCDSIAHLNLDLIYLEVETDFFCEYGLFNLQSQVILAIPGTSGIDYEWYHDGQLVSQDANFSYTEPGSFDLFVSYTINGVTCTFPATTNPLVINLDDLVPDAPILDQYSNTACALDFPTYSVIEDNDILSYEWTANPPGVPISGNGNPEVDVSWQGFDGGTICVHAVNHCGPGVDTCFDVTVIPSPIADFSMPSVACVDSAVTITFTGQSSPDATFIWNFGSGVTILSGGSGPGPHVVSWGAPGTQTVSLQVAEMGCDTNDISFDITIEALGQPVVSCTSTLTSVTFEWENVPGAGSYMVNVLQGPNGTQMDDTSYVVTGLTPGDTVQIEVVAIGLGACAEQSATAQCIAQSCPARMLAIQIPSDSICLGDVSGPIPLTATVDGLPASGTWSGPGVDPSGTFDPHDPGVGVGQFQIVFMYSEGTCTYQRSRTVYVLDTPTATFNADLAICESANASVQYTGTASVNANFTWDFNGGTVVSGTGAGPYSIHWNTPGMHTVSLMVEENGCPSQPFSQMIDVQPELQMPVIQCFPTTSSATIQWSMVPNATAYDVTTLFGPAGTVTGNQYAVTGLQPGDSIAIELMISGSGECPALVIEASCVAKECPADTIVLTPVNDICLYPGTGTEDLDVTVINGNGSGAWSGTGIIDVNQGIFDPVMAGAGAHVISYNYQDDGCNFTESITINVYDPPVAVISNTSFILTCDNGNQLDLDGSSSTAPGTIVYNWSTAGGLFLGLTNGPTATVGAPGDYTLLVTDMTSGCTDMATVSVMQDAGVPTADAGPDGLINCNVSSVVLGGNSSTGTSIEYLWSTTDGVIASDPTAMTITVTAGGTYQLQVNDTSNGCESTDQATVAVDTLHPSAIVDVADILDCDTKSTDVSAMVLPAGGSYSYQWSTTNGQIQGSTSGAQITATRPGIYTVYVVDQNNGCGDSASAEVFADPAVINALETTTHAPDCVGDLNGQIEITSVVGGTQPYTYAWSNQATGTVITNLAPGGYSVTVTDANGCTLTESFTLAAPVPLDPDIGPNLRVNVNDIVTLTLSITDSARISDVIWEGVAPACPGCFSVQFTAEVPGDVFVTVVDSNGCEATASMHLNVYRPRNIFFPSVFSPNGDGINDIFRIQGNTLVKVEELRVFDRWGSLVYEGYDLDPFSNKDGWDGTYKGKGLDPGVYVFMAKLLHDDQLEEYISGSITLVR